MSKLFRFTIGIVLSLVAAGLHAAGNLKVTLSPTAAVSAGAQWRVDNGSWQASGATVKGLNAGSHAVDFRIVNGWIAPASTSANIVNGSTTSLTATYVQAATVTVTLTPSTAQWRIDNGTWQNSGATVANLAPGNHTIAYSSLAGYQAPAGEAVTLSAGTTLTLQRAYIQYAQFSVTLTPTTAQWRVNGGTWQSSGAVAGLLPGSYTVDYVALNGYIAPGSETISVTAGQVLSIARSYVQLAQLTIVLSPDTAQWRIDGGAWLASGTTASNLALGAHTIDYAPLSGYSAPAAESITLTQGQSLSLSRSYVQLAQLGVTLTPSSGQWRLDGGAWQASGATLPNLIPGNHTVEYSALTNYITPSTETVSLAPGQALALQRTYVQLAQILIGTSPSAGQWRINGGAWQSSGTSLMVPAGTYTIDYSSLSGYTSPPSETITLAPGGIFATTRYYTSQKPTLQITLSPTQGQWRLDGGAWFASGANVTEIEPGTHTIEYLDFGAAYAPPPTETISLNLLDHISLARAYVHRPGQLQVIAPTSGAQWRTYPVGGQPDNSWHLSGDTVSSLAAGDYIVEYGAIPNYTSPATETVTIQWAQLLTLNRSYTPNPSTVTVNLTPATGQWRIYPQGSTPSGGWTNSGGSIGGLAPGTYTVQFSDVDGYENPGERTVTLYAGGSPNVFLYVSYNALPQLTVQLYPSAAQWRVDNGSWQASGATVTNLTAGTPHTIEYAPVAGYIAPPSESITLSMGQQQSIYRFYTALATITATLYPSNARWRVDGGNWLASGTSAIGLAAGDHTIDYEATVGYVTPPSESVNVYQGQDLTLYCYYMSVPQITVALTPTNGQWRVDGGAWQNSNATVYVSTGTHVVEYAAHAGYITPPRETYELHDSETRYVSTQYVAAGQLSIALNPTDAQWRVDDGPWQASGAVVGNLWPGYHRVDYSDVTAYITPGYEMVNVPGGQLTNLSRTYTAIAQISIATYPSSTRWRVNGGEWYLNGMTYTLPQGGNYTVDYLTPDTYQPIPSEVVTLTAGQLVTLTRYSPSVTSPTAGQLLIHANPSSIPLSYAQFAVDLGTYMYAGWYVCGQTVPLPAGRHWILFAQGSVGWQEPAPIEFDIVAGATTELTVTFHPVNHVRFFIDQSLVGAITTDELARRLSQYSADLNTIFSRESLRQIRFDSYYDVNVVTQDPFTNPPYEYYPKDSLWVYIRATDNPAVGTYGGSPAVAASGPAGGTGFKWDQVYDPAALAAGTPQLEQYWRQLHNLTRVLELSFGAGAGEYATLGGMKDLSGSAPVVADTAAPDSATSDPFWATRTEYWADPLTANAWNNPRLGSPVSHEALIATVHFAPITSKLVSENARGADRQAATLPNLSNVAIHIVDAQTGQPIAAASVRVWNRSDPAAAATTFEESVTTPGNGVFNFSWTDAATALTSAANAKLIKASASGYGPAAQWITIYDAQKAKAIDGNATFDVTVTLTPQ